MLLPAACARCGAPPGGPAPLCRGCDALLPRLARPDAAVPPAGLTGCVAAAAYAGEAERWIRLFKYPPRGLAGLDPGPGAVVRALAVEAARHLPVRPDAVAPVPLHPRRLRARGFHPAGQLGRAVARELGVVLAPRLLARTRDTPSQTGLDRAARRRNVTGAFCARGPAPRGVLVVDDVTTTGATLAEAARALRRAGARRVWAACAARTL